MRSITWQSTILATYHQQLGANTLAHQVNRQEGVTLSKGSTLYISMRVPQNATVVQACMLRF